MFKSWSISIWKSKNTFILQIEGIAFSFAGGKKLGKAVNLRCKALEILITDKFFHVVNIVVMDREEVQEMMNKKKTGSETLAAFEEHLNEVLKLFCLMFLFKSRCQLEKSLNHVSFLIASFKLQKFKNELRKNREKILGAASESSSKTKRKEVPSLFKIG